MKKFFKIMTMLATAALLVGATACSNDDADYTPGKLPDGDNIYFGQELTNKVVELEKDVNECTVFVRRAKAGDAYTVKIKVGDGTSELLTIPATAKFEAGALEAPLKITYDFSKLQADSKYVVALTLDDMQTTPFGESSVKFSLSYIPEIEWETDASGNLKTLTGVMSENVVDNAKHTVKILKQKGKNYYRIERVMYQIFQEYSTAESDFGECENISFSLDANYEPIKPENFTCDFGYDLPGFGRLGFFFGNEYDPALFNFVRSGYTYTLNGFYTKDGEPWNQMAFKLKITNNPFDSEWDTRFLTNYNTKYEYTYLPGNGTFTSTAFPDRNGAPQQWEQQIGLAQDDEGNTIYYLSDVYAENLGMALVYTPANEAEGIEEMLSFPDDQPTGLQSFGKDIYLSRSRIVPLELTYDDAGYPKHATIPVKLHYKDGTLLGEFVEEFDFEFVPAGDVTPFLGTYAVAAKDLDNEAFAAFDVTISRFDTDVSEILGKPNAVKVSGLVPAEFMAIFGTTDQGFVPAYFDPLRNRLTLDVDLLYRDETLQNGFTWSFPTKDGVVEFIPGIRPADYYGAGEMVNTAYMVRDETTGALSLQAADAYALIMFKPDLTELIGNFDFVMGPAFTPAPGFRASTFLPAVKAVRHTAKQLKNEMPFVRKAAFKHLDASHLKAMPELMPMRRQNLNIEKRTL